MAHIAADGSKWSNAAQARRVPVPGRAQGDGKQPVKSFSKPEAPRAPTAEPVTASSQSGDHAAADSTSASDHAPTVEVSQDGNMFVVTAKFASADEAHAAAQAMSGDQDQPAVPNPAQAMM
jgi:hypothetical protein